MLIVLSPIAYSFNIPADSDEIDVSPSDRARNEKQPTYQTSSENGGGHNQIIEQEDGVGAPIQLIKEISPDGNGSHLVNTTLKARVDVLLTGKELKNIQILESIDPSLKVFNISKAYIINNLLEFPKIERGFEDPENVDKLTKGIAAFTIVNKKNSFNNLTKEFDNDTLYMNKYKINNDSEEYSSLYNYNNNTIFIEKINNKKSEKVVSDNIGKKGRIVYWYYIMPEKSGTYSTRTIIRTDDEYNDIDETTKINVQEHNPKFEVTISGKKTDLDCGEILNISYNIKYLGGSVDPYICDLAISDASNEYEIADGRSFYREAFRLNEIKQICFNVVYRNQGKYFLPDLTISGESMLAKSNRYTFKGDVIEVVGWTKRNTDLITWIILGLGIILAQIYSADLNKATRSLFKILGGIRLFDTYIANFRNKCYNPTLMYLNKKLKYEKKIP